MLRGSPPNWHTQYNENTIDTALQVGPSGNTDRYLARGRANLTQDQQQLLNEGGASYREAKDIGQQQNHQRAQEILAEMISAVRGQSSVRRGGPAYNMAPAEGYNIMPGNEGMFNQQTLLPLPFDDYYSKSANFMAVVNSLPRDLYGANEQVITMINEMVPTALYGMWYEPSMYEGVSGDFFRNRVNIMLERQRTDHVYAYV